MPRIVAEVETEAVVDFEVYCRECGAGMCGRTKVDGQEVHVYPCTDCLTESYNRGEEEGKQEVQEERQAEIEELKAELESVTELVRLYETGGYTW